MSLGTLSDYRVEVALATWRAFEMLENDHALFSYSLLDNLAYHYISYSDHVSAGTIDDAENARGYLTSGLLYAMLVDSFRADVIVYIPLSDDAMTNSYGSVLDEFFVEAMDQGFGMKYITLDGALAGVSELTELIEKAKEADGTSGDTEELSEEDA